MKPRRPAQRRASNGDCVIPPATPPEAAGQFVLNGAHHEEQAIREYVEWQTRDEKVTHAEKVKTERLRDRKLDAWERADRQGSLLGHHEPNQPIFPVVVPEPRLHDLISCRSDGAGLGP
jgi:predicted transcriptional regulator